MPSSWFPRVEVALALSYGIALLVARHDHQAASLRRDGEEAGEWPSNSGGTEAWLKCHLLRSD